jgi:TctA family transporter
MLVPNAGFLIAVAALVAVLLVAWALALWVVLRRPDEEIRATRIPRRAWIVLILLFGPIGALAYLIAARLGMRAKPSPA